MNVTLETPRLILREISANKDDLAAYLGWLRDTQNNSFIQSAKINYGLEELVDFIEAINLDANALLLGIFLVEEDKFIGTLKVQPIDFPDSTAWLGIMIGSPESRGLGYGREALERVLSYLFNSLQIREVFLGVDLKNIPAISLYKSLGFSEYKTEINSVVMRKTNIT